jgi:RecB family endonuclease NucS
MIEIIKNPNSSDALKFINNYHKLKSDKTFLMIIGKCMVNYHGRAKSILDWGERIIMIKQDGNILVHQPIMREPINWQPSGSRSYFNIENRQLILRSNHNHPPEKMKIIFKNIKLIIATSLYDKSNLIITGMETDIVNDIINNPDIIEKGLRINKREKHVKSGLIDLFGHDKNHKPVVIEVKRSIATISSVHQLRMYVKDIKKNIKKAEVRGILCAPHIPDMVKNLLADNDLEWKEVERRIIIPDDFQKTLKDFSFK